MVLFLGSNFKLLFSTTLFTNLFNKNSKYDNFAPL